MQCNVDGIGISKAELAALLAYADKPKGDEDTRLAVVHFLIDGDRCFAYATNGHRAIECDGESDGRHGAGEWLVARQFLDSTIKLLTDKYTLRVTFSGASLTHATIEDEMGGEVSSYHWPRDAANAQMSFPQVRELIKIPDHKKRAKCFTLASDYMADLKIVARAAGREGIDLYPPPTPDKPLFFRVQSDATTTWTGVIMPMRNDAAEFDDDGEDAAE